MTSQIVAIGIIVTTLIALTSPKQPVEERIRKHRRKFRLPVPPESPGSGRAGKRVPVPGASL